MQTTWELGDFNRDAATDFEDFSLLSNNFGQSAVFPTETRSQQTAHDAVFAESPFEGILPNSEWIP